MARTKAPRARLNMRIPEPLLKWAKKYVDDRNTTVTQLIIDHLTSLKDRQEKAHG
jgi:hypothetical protein